MQNVKLSILNFFDKPLAVSITELFGGAAGFREIFSVDISLARSTSLNQ